MDKPEVIMAMGGERIKRQYSLVGYINVGEALVAAWGQKGDRMSEAIDLRPEVDALMAEKYEVHLGWDSRWHLVKKGSNHPHCDPFTKTRHPVEGEPTCLECYDKLQFERREAARKLAKKYQGELFDATD